MKKKLPAFVAAVALFYLLTGYIIGMLTDFLKMNQESFFFSPEKAQQIKIQTDPIKALKNVFANPDIQKAWLGFTTFILIAGILMLLPYKERMKLLFGNQAAKDPRGTYGTSDWMTEKEARKVLGFNKPGLILGKSSNELVTLPFSSRFNKHVMVLGATGAGKSRTFIIPNVIALAEAGHSMVITDPSGEILEHTYKYLLKKGYFVKALNLVDFTLSDPWNLLDSIENEEDAQVFADIVIKNTEAGRKSGDPFWDRAELNLLKALVLYVKDKDGYVPVEKQNMAKVYDLLASKDPAMIAKLFENLPDDKAAKMAYNLYSQVNEKVKSGVVMGLGTRLQLFQNKLVRRITSYSEIDLLAPKLQKTAYFCIIPDQHSAYNFMSSLFFSFLFIKLVKLHDTTDNKDIRNRHVYFLLDEFCNIGEIPDFTKKISTIRKRNLHCQIVIQSIPQLEDRYPGGQWKEIIGNCDTFLCLGVNDPDTAEYVSTLLGIKSIQTRSTSHPGDFNAIFETERITQSVGKRLLLNPDEVKKFDADKNIVLLRGKNPLITEKVFFDRMKQAKELEFISLANYKQKELSSSQTPEQSYYQQQKLQQEFSCEAQAKEQKEKEQAVAAQEAKALPEEAQEEDSELW